VLGVKAIVDRFELLNLTGRILMHGDTMASVAEQGNAYLEDLCIVRGSGDHGDLGIFRLTTTGLGAHWFAPLASWKGLRDHELGPNQVHPIIIEEIPLFLYPSVCQFNKALLDNMCATKGDQTLARAAFQASSSTPYVNVWTHGIARCILLVRFLFACSPQAEGGVNDGSSAFPIVHCDDPRLDQLPHCRASTLTAPAKKLCESSEKWPQHLKRFATLWRSSALALASQSARDEDVRAGDSSAILTSLLSRASVTYATAQLQTIENNFCWAALGVLGIILVRLLPPCPSSPPVDKRWRNLGD
jgi:hypothetical protein